MSSPAHSNERAQLIVEELVRRGEALAAAERIPVMYAANDDADHLLNDIVDHPHFFVLGCVMDSQIRAERAWVIPYTLSQEIGSTDFAAFLAVGPEAYVEAFAANKLHRFNARMASFFYEAVQHIHHAYHDDASLIWQDTPSSAKLVLRFLEFSGVGIKIATMATNLLVRDFKVALSDHINIDVSPDVHVRQVFARLSLVREQPSIDEVIYCARDLQPAISRYLRLQRMGYRSDVVQTT